MDSEMIMQIAETVTSQKFLTIMLYVISIGWFVSFIFSKSKYNKLLSRCETMQDHEVKQENLLKDVCSENTRLKEENETLKKELDNHD